MSAILGLDVGSNSIGSAWIDLDAREIQLGVSVFPAGIEDSDNKRGAPLNQARRMARSQRRSLHRRAQRKQQMLAFLLSVGLLPQDATARQQLFDQSPWALRRDGLRRELSPFEFGRVLVHLNQRRGAFGLESDGDEEAGKVKEAIAHLQQELQGRTVGEFFADLIDQQRVPIQSDKVESLPEPIRNKGGVFRFHADRSLIRDEFQRLWQAQQQFDGELKKMLTDELRQHLDNEHGDDTWRQRGLLFGQRRTYWSTDTLSRCDLEPTDLQGSKADMVAQEFILLSYVNDLRIDDGTSNGQWQKLSDDQREAVLAALRSQKTAKVRTTLRKALRIDAASRKKAKLPDTVRLNVDVDEERTPPTDWFYREIIHPFGEEEWFAQSDEFREHVNRSLLRFDPKDETDEQKLRQGAARWWKLAEDQIDVLITGWKQRPRKDDRASLSRRAMLNLLPYLREGLNVSEARKEFSINPNSGATAEQRRRYSMQAMQATAADRHYLEKHQGQLPPAPMLANPVVRKAIHEVRRHVNAHIRRAGCRPDYIVIELARDAVTSEKRANEMLARNRKREGIRKKIIEQFSLGGLSKSQEARAVDRVLLCRQQKGACAYTGRSITERMAADGHELETDHIVPRSRSHDNSLANKVLVFRDANRNKGDRTVKEWLAHDPAGFGTVEVALKHLQDESPDEYFTKIECRRKWDNIHKDAPGIEQFANSQLTDTAYIARQVAGYLKNALYADDPIEEGSQSKPRERRVFTTKGQYTAILRREWGLVESQLDREFAHVPADATEPAHGDSGTARRTKKDRRDHLHHAIDALCIAFTSGDRIQQIARIAQAQEAARAQTGHWPRAAHLPAPEPWDDTGHFRRDVMNAVKQIVVCHRPVKRKLVGAFHEETLFGSVVQKDGPHRTENIDTLFTNRISADALSSNHLRMPEEWDNLRRKLEQPDLTGAMQREIRKQLAALKDPSPSKSGIVRDRELRHQIRQSLRQLGFDPDDFDTKKLKPFVDALQLRLPSGVPIKRVVLLRANNAPVRIARKQFNPETGRYEPDLDPQTGEPNRRTQRVYVGGNNHHMEIREGTNGRWNGEVITTFQAAKRLRPPKASGRPRASAVDRSNTDKGRFVMSLAEGEVLYCRRKDRPELASNYYVVCKLNRNAGAQDQIVLAPHWDARRASDQDRWTVTPSELKACGDKPDQPPIKVAINPLGIVTLRAD